jgi:hypothetical protein
MSRLIPRHGVSINRLDNMHNMAGNGKPEFNEFSLRCLEVSDVRSSRLGWWVFSAKSTIDKVGYQLLAPGP